MSDPSSKIELLEVMRAARAQFDSLLEQVSRSRMTMAPGSGEWSVKDIVAHVNSYDRTLGLGLALRLQRPPDFWIEDMPIDEFNRILYEENRNLALQQVLEDSRELWTQILQETESKTETFLFTDHIVQGFPEPVRPCDTLKNETYGHYLQHVPALEAAVQASHGA